MNKKAISGLKIICLNRKASFNFFFEDLIEAGIVLKGSEIKSIREGKVNIADSYAVEKDGEIVLINSHIAAFKQASYSNHNPTDERKLLLNKKEINIIKNRRIATNNTHGTGCTLSSAISTFFSCGKTLKKSCELASKYVNHSIRSNPKYGKGHGPINHLCSTFIKKKFR